MTDEEKKSEEEEAKKAEAVETTDKADDDKEEEKEKAKSIVDSLKAITNALNKQTEKFDELDNRMKALETPTDLPLKPKESAPEDIGAKVKTPDTYQANSQQAGIKDADPENERKTDPSGLKMQEKTVTKGFDVAPENTLTTETPRPGGVANQNVLKSAPDGNPILTALRSGSTFHTVSKSILRGDYGKPSEDEGAW